MLVQPAPAKTPAGGTERDWRGRVKHTTASTAALCRIVTDASAQKFGCHQERLPGFTLPRQLRRSATRPAHGLVDDDAEEEMTAVKAECERDESGRWFERKPVRLSLCVLAMAMILAAPASLAGRSHEERITQSRTINRAAIENLQRWVDSGHETWCRDARMVASYQLERIAPDFSGERHKSMALPLETKIATGSRRVFEWTPLDGRATYQVTVERFAWLKRIAGRRDAIVWVPTRTEIIAHE